MNWDGFSPQKYVPSSDNMTSGIISSPFVGSTVQLCVSLISIEELVDATSFALSWSQFSMLVNWYQLMDVDSVSEQFKEMLSPRNAETSLWSRKADKKVLCSDSSEAIGTLAIIGCSSETQISGKLVSPFLILSVAQSLSYFTYNTAVIFHAQYRISKWLSK